MMIILFVHVPVRNPHQKRVAKLVLQTRHVIVVAANVIPKRSPTLIPVGVASRLGQTTAAVRRRQRRFASITSAARQSRREFDERRTLIIIAAAIVMRSVAVAVLIVENVASGIAFVHASIPVLGHAFAYVAVRNVFEFASAQTIRQ